MSASGDSAPFAEALEDGAALPLAEAAGALLPLPPPPPLCSEAPLSLPQLAVYQLVTWACSLALRHSVSHMVEGD